MGPEELYGYISALNLELNKLKKENKVLYERIEKLESAIIASNLMCPDEQNFSTMNELNSISEPEKRRTKIK